MRHAAALVLAMVLASAAPSGARAFRLAATFDDDAELAGGGGRHFTGSLRDGYSCGVCHVGAETPRVELRGLPDDGYVPGEQYEIEVALPDEAFVTSMALELTDERGDAAGTVALPDTALLDPAEMCDPVAGQPAAIAGHVIDLADGRSVVATDACGQLRARAFWTAPADPLGAVWLDASIVGADGSNDPTGDGAVEISRILPVRGESAEAARVGSGCSASGGTGGGWGAVSISLLALALVRAARRGGRCAAAARGPR